MLGKKRKLTREQLQAIFAKKNSGISSKDVQNSQRSSHHVQPHWLNHQRSESSTDKFPNTILGKNRKIKTVIPPKKQSEPKSAPQFTPKITPNTDFSKLIKPLQKISEDKFAKIIAGTIVTGISVATGNPVPLLVYKALVTANTINKISQRMKQINLENELKEITKQNLERVSQDIVKQRTEQISKKVTEHSQELGIIRIMSDLTKLSENSTRTLYQNTVNDSIDSGIGSLIDIGVSTLL